MSVENTELVSLATQFGIKVSHLGHAPQSNLSSVFIIDDAYVLRARALTPDLDETLEQERYLLETVRKFVHVAFPVLMSTPDGRRYIEAEGKAWTLYPLIHGEILCNWPELYYSLDESEWRASLSFMREMHDATRDKMPVSNAPYSLASLVEPALMRIGANISSEARRRMHTALEVIGKYEFREKRRSFVHGDMHPGNMLFSHNKVTGLIDVDWCHIGYWQEDLAYFIGMALRDYRKPTFMSLDRVFLNSLIAWYGVSETDVPLLMEYVLVGTLYDLDLFVRSPQIPKQGFYVEFQREMVEKIIDVL